MGQTEPQPARSRALATAGSPLDRRRLAELLGFDGVVVFVQDVHIQYHQPVPWLTLDPSLTHGSSIMPKKGNPGQLESLGINCTMVAGDAQTVWMLVHNASSGMNDLKEGTRVVRTSDERREMYKTFAVVVGGLVAIPQRALAEVDADYSTTTEVADTLLREPMFRFASATTMPRKSPRMAANMGSDRRI